MRIAAYVAFAVALGVIVMLAPLMVFTSYGYRTVVSQSDVGKRFVSERVWNETDASLLGGNNSNFSQILTFSEAAQLYGWMDAAAEPFPTSLVPMVLLVTTGFVTALGVTLLLKKRM